MTVLTISLFFRKGYFSRSCDTWSGFSLMSFWRCAKVMCINSLHSLHIYVWFSFAALITKVSIVEILCHQYYWHVHISKSSKVAIRNRSSLIMTLYPYLLWRPKEISSSPSGSWKSHLFFRLRFGVEPLKANLTSTSRAPSSVPWCCLLNSLNLLWRVLVMCPC